MQTGTHIDPAPDTDRYDIDHISVHTGSMFQFQITLLSPNIHFPQYTCTPKDYINTCINNSVNLSNVMGANGAGNPVGFMGSLSDTLNIIYHNKGAGGATVTTHFVSNMQHTAL